MKLKIEINTREHFTELGLARVPFTVDGRWFAGAADGAVAERAPGSHTRKRREPPKRRRRGV